MNDELPVFREEVFNVADVFSQILQYGEGAQARLRLGIVDGMARELARLEGRQGESLARVQEKALEIYQESFKHHLANQGILAHLFGFAVEFAEADARRNVRRLVEDALYTQDAFLQHALERRMLLLEKAAAIEAKSEQAVEAMVQRMLPGVSTTGLPRITLERIDEMPEGVFEERF